MASLKRQQPGVPDRTVFDIQNAEEPRSRTGSIDFSIREPEEVSEHDIELERRYHRMNFFQKYILELIFMTYAFPAVLLAVPATDVIMKKACLYYLNYSIEVCSNITDEANKDFSNEVERVTKSYGLYRDILLNVPGIFVSVIAGQYMARYGSKVPLIVAHIGTWSTVIAESITFWFMPLPLYFTTFAYLPSAFTGGLVVYMTAIFSNITITCPAGKRKGRFLTIQFFMIIPMVLAMASGGPLYKAIEIRMLTLLTCILFIIPLVLLLVFFKDTGISDKAKKESFREVIKHSTSVKTFKQSVSYVIKPRPGHARGQVFCMFICLMVGTVAFAGAGDLNQIYVKHLYRWEPSYYALMNSISMVTVFVMSVPIMILLTKILKLADPILISLGFACFAAKYFVMSLMYIGQFMYYIQLVIGIPFIVGLTAIRSHLSRLFEEHEITVIFSLTSAAEKIFPTAFDAMVTAIYNASNDFFAGLVFAVQGAIFFIPLTAAAVCAIWTAREGYPKYEKEPVEDDTKYPSTPTIEPPQNLEFIS